ncbi:uncharacterized protein [Haliotis asinina]|uniref:uncharacterized protein n=1 Tax=Haliotis asinina TaxID=109174 RepID=UPI003531F40F
MRLRIRRAFYTLSVVNLLVFLFYLYGLASTVPKDTVEHLGRPKTRKEETVKPAPTTTVRPISESLQFGNRSSQTCQHVKRPIAVPDIQQFQKVGHSNAFYVFSAFFDDVVEASPIVRLLGLSTRGGGGPLYCQLWFNDSTGPDFLEVPIHVQRIPEDHGRKYGAVYLKCSLPHKRRPYAVSVTRQSCEPPTNYLPVIHSEKMSHEFTVCVTPFNFKYSRAYELVEMVEFNKLMGAGLVMFYNQSTGKNVDAVLQHYSKEGSAEVVQWHLPMKVDTWPPSGSPEVHYFAQLAALNDCVYRNLHRSKYLVFTDMDEFVIPKAEKNWTSMVQKKVAKNPNIGAFIIRCNFFRKDWPQYSKDFAGRSDAEKYKSILLLNVLKENKAFNYFQRSKYIIVPSRVETVGIHNIWALRPGFITDRVSTNDALLHHYRNWENPNDSLTRVEDLVVHGYKDKLLERLRYTWGKLPGVVMDIPLSNYSKPV